MAQVVPVDFQDSRSGANQGPEILQESDTLSEFSASNYRRDTKADMPVEINSNFKINR